MTPSNGQLHARLKAACFSMVLCSQGSTQNLQGRITGTKEFGRPSGEGRPEWEKFTLDFARCKTRAERELVVLEAEAYLSAWKRQSEPEDREYERGSLAWKRMVANHPGPASEVHRLFGVGSKMWAGLISQYREQTA